MLNLDYAKQEERKKMHSDDRIFVIEQGPDKPKLNSGIVDNRLFSGGNRLHAIRDPQFNFWTLKYEKGILPEQLKQTFTRFSVLQDFVTNYFKVRGLVVSEIKDWDEE